MPEPTITPTRSPSGLSVEGRRPQSELGGGQAELDEEIVPARLFLVHELCGIEALDLAGDPTGQVLTSKRVMRPTPDFPAMAASHDSLVPIPKGVTRPIPVTTTLRSTRCMI